MLSLSNTFKENNRFKKYFVLKSFIKNLILKYNFKIVQCNINRNIIGLILIGCTSSNAKPYFSAKEIKNERFIGVICKCSPSRGVGIKWGNP